jgi:hypothetical protein
MIGGGFLIHSEIGKGTQVEARLPIVVNERPEGGTDGRDYEFS